ncbi:MAG: hypothetical protein MZU95_10200 [Desulfomicrobium escambiense]|nr:hypothetical protein [Desulfomicrobium escambiense]
MSADRCAGGGGGIDEYRFRDAAEPATLPGRDAEDGPREDYERESQKNAG